MSIGGELTLRTEDRAARDRRSAQRDIALIDLLDRLLEGGVSIHGEIMLTVAGIDLVELDLRLLVASVDKAARR